MTPAFSKSELIVEIPCPPLYLMLDRVEEGGRDKKERKLE
jgi:hypothetical protein